MKKLFLLIFLAQAFFSFGQIQNKNISFSTYKTNIDELKKTEILQCFKVESNYILITKRAIVGPGGWFYSVEKYDQNFKEISRFNISEYATNNSLIINNHAVLKDKLFLVFEEKKDDIATGTLFYTFFDFNINEMGNQFPFIENTESTKYILTQSPDDSIMMIVAWESSNDNSLNKKFSFDIVDRNFEEIISYKDFAINLEGDLDYLTNFQIDNEARVYWLQVTNSCKSLDEMFATEAKDISQKVEIKQLEYSILTTQPILIPEKKINSVGIKIQEDNSLFIGGYYGDSIFTKVSGTFIISNPFGKKGATLLQTKEFGQDLLPPPIEEMTSQEKRKYEHLSLNDLKLDDVIILENGDATVIGHMEEITYNYSTQNFSNNIYSAYFGDYIVTNFQSNGNKSNSKFENYQSMAPASTYCKYFKIDDEIVILKEMNGLETLKNNGAEISKKEKKELKKKHAIYITTIDNNGSQTSDLLIDYTNPDFLDIKNNRWLTNRLFFLPEEKEAILFCEFKDNTHGFVKIQF